MEGCTGGPGFSRSSETGAEDRGKELDPRLKRSGVTDHCVKADGPVPPPENPRAAPSICRLPLKGGVVDGAGDASVDSCLRRNDERDTRATACDSRH